LRKIVLSCGLTEELKWGCPCYTLADSNIVLIHGFKDFYELLFMKGALLKDPKHTLIQQTKNVKAASQIRFTRVDEISEAVMNSYIKEAVKAEKAGLTMPLKKTAEFEMPVEFKNILAETPRLKKAFYELTPGRQRGYLLYFSSAKQLKTRESRIEKYIPQILKDKRLEE